MYDYIFKNELSLVIDICFVSDNGYMLQNFVGTWANATQCVLVWLPFPVYIMFS